MIKLEVGNVMLKPSHRRQLMTWLKRSLRMGERLGDFALTITMRRDGRQVEVRADVHDSAGDFACRSRQPDWHSALREMVRQLSGRLHDQYIQRLSMA